ncbi:MAG: tetratricopeptide repeat protein [Ignavibacteria bacterium]|nr:tetratricopeptide repeat protein [Ignavibacteria bacterium]
MERFKQLLQEAFELFKQQNYTAALANLHEAKEIYRPGAESGELSLEDLYMFEGGIYYTQKNFGKALISFETALKENPKSSMACLHLGKTFLQMNNIPNARVMLQYALLYDETNDVAKAILEQLPESEETEDKPLTPEVALDNAYLFFNEKKYSESLLALNVVEAEYKEMLAGVYNFQGFNLLAMRDIEKAHQAFISARELNGESSQAYAGLGEVSYLQSKDYEAKEFFETAVRLNPENQFALSGLNKVNTVLEAASQPVVDMAVIEEKIGLAFKKFSEKQYAEALPLLIEAETNLRSLKTPLPDIISRLLNFKGFTLMSLQRISEAQGVFEESLKTNPQSSQAAAGLGEIFYLQDNYEAALQMFDWGVKLNPDNHFAKEGVQKVQKIIQKD